ncbi:PorP/SprF family type IX secretion system membrane protein [Bacteroidota bacterium]
MSKKIHMVVIFLLAFLWSEVKSQQLPHLTQYMLNNFLFNPALAGTFNHYKIKTSYRYQWLGLPVDAPQTINFAMYGPHDKLDMGYGGYLYSDSWGPNNILGIMGSYGYNIGLTNEIRLSFGISGGIIQYKLDLTGIETYEPDRVATGIVLSDIKPDASLGVYAYSNWFYGGLAAHRLLGGKFDYQSEVDTLTNAFDRLRRHVYLTGGTLLRLNRYWVVEPSINVKGTYHALPQFEISAKATYELMVWGGLSYRYQDAVSLLVGYNHDNKFGFGLSYDIITNKLRQFAKGSVELMLSYKFDEIPGKK